MCYTVSVSPVTDASYQFGEGLHQMNKVSRRWAPTSDIDSVSFVESLSDSDDQRFVFLLECNAVFFNFFFEAEPFAAILIADGHGTRGCCQEFFSVGNREA